MRQKLGSKSTLKKRSRNSDRKYREEREEDCHSSEREIIVVTETINKKNTTKVMNMIGTKSNILQDITPGLV